MYFSGNWKKHWSQFLQTCIKSHHIFHGKTVQWCSYIRYLHHQISNGFAPLSIVLFAALFVLDAASESISWPQLPSLMGWHGAATGKMRPGKNNIIPIWISNAKWRTYFPSTDMSKKVRDRIGCVLWSRVVSYNTGLRNLSFNSTYLYFYIKQREGAPKPN